MPRLNALKQAEMVQLNMAGMLRSRQHAEFREMSVFAALQRAGKAFFPVPLCILLLWQPCLKLEQRAITMKK